MSEGAVALDLSCFADRSIPRQQGADPRLISNYPSIWTQHYMLHHYVRIDPVIIQVIGHPEPFERGLGVGSLTLSKPQQELFEEAARFGIRYGFTVPIHDSRGPTTAVTFAADRRRPSPSYPK